MKGIDTNILVRFLIGDDKVQTDKVYKMFKRIETEKRELFVPLLVILELIWVLDSVYDISREDILLSLSDLLLMPVLKFDQQPSLQKFVQNARTCTNDLSDILIAQSAHEQGCSSVIAFDQKASNHKMFELIT